MRMTFALLTDSTASERLRARRLSSRRSQQKNTVDPQIAEQVRALAAKYDEAFNRNLGGNMNSKGDRRTY
jgi:hypothetical protein